MRGDQVLGARNGKKKRGKEEPKEAERVSGGVGEDETPKERTLEEMNFEELRNEMRRRKLKVGKKQREGVINLLRKDDKGQMMIFWGKQHMGDTGAAVSLSLIHI